jgi:hypothetical protein
VGPSILSEYPEIDLILQGEGEQPLVKLLVELDEAGDARHEYVAKRRREPPPPLWEVDRLDRLPMPDYDEFAAQAEQQGIAWWLPIEGSRGCWWDRTKRTGNPKANCYFCNLNVQWNGYREKSSVRVVEELDHLTERYQNTNVYFLDNIIRIKGVEDLARGIARLGKDFRIFYELRANVTPMELLALREAGLSAVQLGIEALSPGVLDRIGKGTTVLQNLQAMRTCQELGITNIANLILDFPGCTAEEVTQTRDCILRYAIAYEPCGESTYHLGMGSTLDTLRGEFGITNLRNDDAAKTSLPEGVFRRLKLFDLTFDHVAPVSWDPVREACETWRRKYQEAGRPLLSYQDGGSFLRIEDRRVDHNIVTLAGAHRAVYLACMEAKSRDQTVRHLGGQLSAADVEALLGELVEAGLTYTEGGRYLSLAVATRPEFAARRMRRSAMAVEAERQAG